MNLKSLTVVIIAVAVGFIAYHVGTKPNSGPDGVNSQLLPGLSKHLNEVSKLTILGADETLLAAISRSDKNWVVENRDNYIADIALVREAFNNLAEAKLIEAKTSNTENFSKLGVEDITEPTAQGVQVIVEGLGKEINFIAGDKGNAGDNSQYIRLYGDQQSWLINKNLDLKKDASNWLKKDLLDIPPERIKSIQIKHEDQTVLDIENKGSEQFEFVLLNALPEGKKISESEVYQVANSLSSLQLIDVALADKLDFENAQHVVTTFQTFDGLTIKADSYITNEQAYSMLEIEFNLDKIDESINPDQDENSGSDAAVRSDPEAAKQSASKMGPKLKGWAFELPSITQDALIKTLDNFALDE